MDSYDPGYWAERAKTYNVTKWVKDNDLLTAFLSLLPKRTFNKVLEVGIGTGVVALKMVDRLSKIIGIDLSPEMMSQINHPEIETRVADAHKLPFEDHSFDLIYMRNVLHYLTDPKQVFFEINRCLNSAGIFLFSQVVPFSDDISQEYDWLIDRDMHYPTISEILSLFRDFELLHESEFILEKQSIMNWLNNTCSDRNKRLEVIKRHQDTSDTYKRKVKYFEKNGDIFVNIKHFMVLSSKINVSSRI